MSSLEATGRLEVSHAQLRSRRLRPSRGVDSPDGLGHIVYRIDSAAGGQPWTRTVARAHLIDTDKPICTVFLMS